MNVLPKAFSAQFALKAKVARRRAAIYLCIAALATTCLRLNIASAQAPPPSETVMPQATLHPKHTELNLLPEVGADLFDPLLISHSNGARLKRLIPPELHTLVRSGQLILPAGGLVPEAPDNASTPSTDTLTPASFPASRGVSGALIPFGGVATLQTEGDPLILAKKILWNAESLWWRHKFLQASLQLSIFNELKLQRELHGSWSRLYSSRINGSTSPAQLSRELLEFARPDSIAGLAFLWFRLFGRDEEPLWIYSPAIHRVRQLVSSNRSDALFGNSIALNEILVWSGKTEGINAVTVGQELLLMPLGTVETAAFQAPENDPGCLHKTAAPIGNIESPRRATLGWERYGTHELTLPAGALFVPRNVWRLELGAFDPFANHGRQVLYVDQESNLPLLRIAYDRAGELMRVTAGFFGSAENAPVRERFHYPVAIMSIDVQRKTHSLLFFNDLRLCTELPAEVAAENFDPIRLEQRSVKAAEQRSAQQRPGEGND